MDVSFLPPSQKQTLAPQILHHLSPAAHLNNKPEGRIQV